MVKMESVGGRRNWYLCVPEPGTEDCQIEEPTASDLLPMMMTVEAAKIPASTAANNTQDRWSWMGTVEPSVTQFNIMVPLRAGGLLELELSKLTLVDSNITSGRNEHSPRIAPRSDRWRVRERSAGSL